MNIAMCIVAMVLYLIGCLIFLNTEDIKNKKFLLGLCVVLVFMAGAVWNEGLNFNKHEYKTNSYTFNAEIRTKIVNDSIVKSDTVYVIKRIK